MSKFIWKGIDNKTNSIVTGEIETESESSASLELTKKDIKIMSIKKVDRSILEKRSNSNSINIKLNSKKEKEKSKKEIDGTGKMPKNKVKLKELMLFTKQLGSMFRAGLPLLEVFFLLGKQVENPKLKYICINIRKDIEGGTQLSDAFAKYPTIFDNIYINMIKSGEKGGQLDTFLMKLTQTIEKTVILNKTVKKALFKPIMLLFVTFLVIMVLFIYVVPVFADMYGSSGKALPGPTQAVIDISEFLKDPTKGGVLVFSIVSLVFTHIFMAKKSKAYKYKLDQLLLKLPLFKDLFIKSTVSKISLLLGNLQGAGIPLPEVLDIASDSLNNQILKDSIFRVREGVLNGNKMSDLFMKEEIYPLQFEAMIKVGEESGNMEEMLKSVAEYYEEEVNDVVDKITGMIEPAMLLFIGFSIGFILVAMYMPIFNMGNAM